MDYLEYFGLSAEPFSHAPVARFYYASRQHTDALKRLMHAAHTMKGLSVLIGDIGHGKTTLARRLLDALPPAEYEAAMLVIVHAGVTAHWLLKRIATQLGVTEPSDDKLSLLSQLYQRLVEIHQAGKRTVVLIDEAQMLASRELMEEFRGLLNLEVPGHKLISFVFFGLPDIDNNLQLDPALAQRVALRFHLRPLGVEETTAYVKHRLQLCGAKDELFAPEALEAVHAQTRGVPRLINTLCDNVLLELFFGKLAVADAELVLGVAQNLGLGDYERPRVEAPVVEAPRAYEDGARDDAESIITVEPSAAEEVDPDAIAARVAAERQAVSAIDIEDPLSFLHQPEVDTKATPDPAPPVVAASAEPTSDDEAHGFEIALGSDVDVSAIKPKLVVPAPSYQDDDHHFEVTSEDEQPLAPPVPPPPPPPVRREPSRTIRTSRGSVDLSAIDELLADLKRS